MSASPATAGTSLGQAWAHPVIGRQSLRCDPIECVDKSTVDVLAKLVFRNLSVGFRLPIPRRALAVSSIDGARTHELFGGLSARIVEKAWIVRNHEG